MYVYFSARHTHGIHLSGGDTHLSADVYICVSWDIYICWSAGYIYLSAGYIYLPCKVYTRYTHERGTGLAACDDTVCVCACVKKK